MLPSDDEYLKEVKLGKYNLTDARIVADQAMTVIEQLCSPFTKKSYWNKSNQEVEELLDWAQGSIIKRSLSNELIQSFEIM